MRSVSSARFITLPLTRRKRKLLNELLDQFAASVNFCIQCCLEHGLTSRASLHRVAYGEWKPRFNLATHWFHSAGQVATQTLRSWRRLCRQGQADPNKPPVYEARTMRLELWGDRNQAGVCRFHGHAVQIRVRNVYVPFKREAEPKRVEGVCGIDINERSVDLTILKPNEQPKHISFDVSKLQAIRHSSQLKRKSVQEKLDTPPQRPVQKRRLRAKYWRRERNRTNQILHIISKQIAEIAERERAAVAFEGIKGIRQSMRSKRKTKNDKALRKDMRRRLNQWPFRKLQFYAEYKVLRQGLPTVEVSNYHKSKDCPMCGRYNRPNGHAYRCKTCGFEASRHLVAGWNIAKDGARHVPADCWQMQRAAEELVAPAKLPVEPEKISVQAGVQFDTEF